MSFYDRYAAICRERGLDPCSQRAPKLFGTNRAIISIWGTKGTTPKGDTVAIIASALNVSADYLLGRTDDPTDWSNARNHKGSVSSGVVMDTVEDKVSTLFSQLDDIDQQKAMAYIEGLLSADKYGATKKRRAR